MIEGLALWALLVFLAVKLGMPWNKITQGGSVVGGILWLVFVWVGMISWSPMDMTGGSIDHRKSTPTIISDLVAG